MRLYKSAHAFFDAAMVPRAQRTYFCGNLSQVIEFPCVLIYNEN